MTLDQETLNNILLFVITGLGAVLAAFWLALILWTWRDMRVRSRDPLAQIAAALLVAVLNVPGLIIYVMLRPQETLAEAYERSLEEEALLQNIEEKAICPGCGRVADDAWQVCPYCHTKLRKPCVNCGELLELAWNLCPYCATGQVALEAAPSAPPVAANLQPPPARSTAPAADYPADQDARVDESETELEFIDDDAY